MKMLVHCKRHAWPRAKIYTSLESSHQGESNPVVILFILSRNIIIYENINFSAQKLSICIFVVFFLTYLFKIFSKTIFIEAKLHHRWNGHGNMHA